MKNYTKYTILLIVTLLLQSSYAQMSRADKLYANFNYPEAIEAYEQELKKSVKKEGYISQRIAESYRMMGDYGSALEWYGKVVSLKGIDPINYFRYGKMLESTGNHDSAQTWFEKYIDRLPTDTRAKHHKKYTKEKIASLLRDEGKFEIAPVIINTEQDEFSPAFVGKKVAFVTNRAKDVSLIRRKHVWNNLPFFDIYVADRQDDNELIDPNPFPQFNGSYHEGPLTFTQDAKRIYFTRNASRGKGLLKGTNKTVNLMDLYRQKGDFKFWGRKMDGC